MGWITGFDGSNSLSSSMIDEGKAKTSRTTFIQDDFLYHQRLVGSQFAHRVGLPSDWFVVSGATT